LAAGDVAQGLSVINTAIDEGADPRQFARQMVEHLRALLLLKLKSGVVLAHVSDDVRPQLEAQAADFSSQALAQAVRLFNQAAVEAKGGWQPQLPLEMAFVEAVLPSETESPAPGKPQPPRPGAPPSRAPSNPAPAPSEARRVNPTRTEGAVRPSSSAPSQAPGAIREPGPTYDSLDPGDGSVTPETLCGSWSDFLNALRPRNLPLEALMRSCEPVAVEGDVIVLGFAHDFHRSRVEEEQNKQDVEQVLSELVGQRYRVRCVLAQQRADESPPTQTEAKATPSVDLATIDDPVVRAAVEDLGAVVRQ
jgi:DNA polymerase-3 subunit gamma/tau